ncbi:hypothetical protein D3C80_1659150 [compost metagenome]
MGSVKVPAGTMKLKAASSFAAWSTRGSLTTGGAFRSTTSITVMPVEGVKLSVIRAVATVFCRTITVCQPVPPSTVPFRSHCSRVSVPCCTRRR